MIKMEKKHKQSNIGNESGEIKIYTIKIKDQKTL